MLSSAALAMFLVEGLKELVQYFTKNPFFTFSPKVMAVLLVVANGASDLILALLGQDGFEFPTDWKDWARKLILAILNSVVSSALYVVGYRPFKFFADTYKFSSDEFKG